MRLSDGRFAAWPIALLVLPLACGDADRAKNRAGASGATTGTASDARDRAGTAGDPNVTTTAFRNAATGEWPAVGLLTNEYTNGDIAYSCTGTLIRTAKYPVSNVVLTAKHCGTDMQFFYLGNGKDVIDFDKMTKQRLLCDGQMSRIPVNLGVPIGPGSSDDALEKEGHVDLQLLQLLYAPEGVQPLMLKSRSELSAPHEPANAEANVIGFGTNPHSLLQGAKHIIPVLLAREKTTPTWFVQLGVPFFSQVSRSTNDRLSHGASGGPLIAQLNGTAGPVLGVVMGEAEDAEKHTSSGYFSRSDYGWIYDKIETQLARWNADTRQIVTASPGERCPSAAGGPPSEPSPSDPTRLGVR